MDYGHSEKRKTKNDKRAKSRYGMYKRGGHRRTHNIPLRNDNKDKNSD